MDQQEVKQEPGPIPYLVAITIWVAISLGLLFVTGAFSRVMWSFLLWGWAWAGATIPGV